MTRQHNVRPRWHKLLLSLTISILFLGFVELVCFLLLKTGVVQISSSKEGIDLVYDYDTIFYNKPNQEACGNFQGVRICHYKTNSQGFRQDDELPQVKEEDEYRIFCVGDSSTFGFRVDQQQTYPSQLQQILGERGGALLHYTVINGGCVGFSSFQAARLLERWLPLIKPDMVVLSIGFNDWMEARKSDKEYDFRRGLFSGIMNLIRHSSFYAVIYETFVKNRDDVIEPGNILRVSADDYGITLRYCVDLVRSHGARIVFLPISVQRPYIDIMQEVATEQHVPLINSEESLWRAYRQMAAGAKEYGGWLLDYDGSIDECYFDYTDYGETRSAEMRTKSYVFTDTIHPNPIGYRAIAEDLAAIIP